MTEEELEIELEQLCRELCEHGDAILSIRTEMKAFLKQAKGGRYEKRAWLNERLRWIRWHRACADSLLEQVSATTRSATADIPYHRARAIWDRVRTTKHPTEQIH